MIGCCGCRSTQKPTGLLPVSMAIWSGINSRNCTPLPIQQHAKLEDQHDSASLSASGKFEQNHQPKNQANTTKTQSGPLFSSPLAPKHVHLSAPRTAGQMTQGKTLRESGAHFGPDGLLFGHCLPDLDVGEADAYLLLDQYPPRGPGAHADPQLLLVPNLIVGPRDGGADCDNGGGSGSGSQSGSPAAQQARKLQGTKGRQPAGRTTSLAQREAHKRYREKKKQSVSEENSVSCKQSLYGSGPKFALALLSTCGGFGAHSTHSTLFTLCCSWVPLQSTEQCYAGCMLPLTNGHPPSLLSLLLLLPPTATDCCHGGCSAGQAQPAGAAAGRKRPAEEQGARAGDSRALQCGDTRAHEAAGRPAGRCRRLAAAAGCNRAGGKGQYRRARGGAAGEQQRGCVHAAPRKACSSKLDSGYWKEA